MCLVVCCSLLFIGAETNAQTVSNTKVDKNYVYKNLEEALKNPAQVFRLDLSNQTIDISADIWEQFVNLEYLSLKNDHLTELPKGFTKLNKLKVLDLSGNDFVRLPRELKKLRALEELYLNNEQALNVDKSVSVLKRMPSLKALHLEDDHLDVFPTRLFALKNLESLYLNKNDIREIPRNLEIPAHLKMIDLRMNKIGAEIDKEGKYDNGLIIRF